MVVTENYRARTLVLQSENRGRNFLGSSTMKSTESIDETAASAGRSLADGEAVSPSQTSLMDQRRRRLVRGAMAVAPLVLTLRSGALAAASCTGLKVTSASTRPADAARPGRIYNTAPVGVTVVPGDVCVETGVLTQCGSESGRVLTSSSLTEANSETVVARSSGGVDWLSCGGSDSTGTPPQWVGKNIAILSSQSASSIGVT